MSKSNTFEEDVLRLIFYGTPITGLADNAASAPLTTLYATLHNEDPGEAGVQTTNETAYTGYARVPISRSGSGWTITGNMVSPAAAIDFGVMTAGTPGTAKFVSIGTHATGGGKILYRGALNPQIAYNEGTVPRLRTNSTITED